MKKLSLAAVWAAGIASVFRYNPVVEDSVVPKRKGKNRSSSKNIPATKGRRHRSQRSRANRRK